LKLVKYIVNKLPIDGGDMMKINEEQLIDQIEYRRQNMIQLASQLSFHSKEVVQASELLDELMNQYHQFLQKS
jgi:hypothetical protein